MITTSAGPSTAVEVALRLLEQLTGAANASYICHLMGFDPYMPDFRAPTEEAS